MAGQALPELARERWLTTDEIALVLSDPAAQGFEITPKPVEHAESGTAVVYSKKDVDRKWRGKAGKGATKDDGWHPDTHSSLETRAKTLSKVPKIKCYYAKHTNGALHRRGYYFTEDAKYIFVHYLAANGTRSSQHVSPSAKDKQKKTAPAQAALPSAAGAASASSSSNSNSSARLGHAPAAFRPDFAPLPPLSFGASSDHALSFANSSSGSSHSNSNSSHSNGGHMFHPPNLHSEHIASADELLGFEQQQPPLLQPLRDELDSSLNESLDAEMNDFRPFDADSSSSASASVAGSSLAVPAGVSAMPVSPTAAAMSFHQQLQSTQLLSGNSGSNSSGSHSSLLQPRSNGFVPHAATSLRQAASSQSNSNGFAQQQQQQSQFASPAGSSVRHAAGGNGHHSAFAPHPASAFASPFQSQLQSPFQQPQPQLQQLQSQHQHSSPQQQHHHHPQQQQQQHLSSLRIQPQLSSAPQPQIEDYAPSWDYCAGGAQLLVCVTGAFSPSRSVVCVFGDGTAATAVPGKMLGTFRVTVPSFASPGVVPFFLTDGQIRTPPRRFEFRSSPSGSASNSNSGSSGNSSNFSTGLSGSGSGSKPVGFLSISREHKQGSFSLGDRNSPQPAQGQLERQSNEREFVAMLIDRLTDIERRAGTGFLQQQQLSSSSSASASAAAGTSFTLQDVKACVLGSKSGAGADDWLEALLLTVMQRAAARGLLTREEVHRADSQGRQLLHYVAGLGCTHILPFLVQLQASINAQDHAGRTPLHTAVLADEGHMVSALLDAGADDNIRDAQGRTAIELADASERHAAVGVFVDLQNAERPIDPQGADEALSSSLSAPTRRLGRGDKDADGDVGMASASSSSASAAASAGNSKVSGSSDSRGDRKSDSSATAAGSSSSGSADAAGSSANDEMSLGRAFSSMTLEDMGISTQEIDASGGVSDEVFAQNVRRIQRKIRWWLYRRHEAVKKLQAVARGMLARRDMKRKREAVQKIESVVQTWRERSNFKRLKKAAVTFQRGFRHRHAHSPNPPSSSARAALGSSSAASASASAGGGPPAIPRAGSWTSPSSAHSRGATSGAGSNDGSEAHSPVQQQQQQLQQADSGQTSPQFSAAADGGALQHSASSSLGAIGASASDSFSRFWPSGAAAASSSAAFSPAQQQHHQMNAGFLSPPGGNFAPQFSLQQPQQHQHQHQYLQLPGSSLSGSLSASGSGPPSPMAMDVSHDLQMRLDSPSNGSLVSPLGFGSGNSGSGSGLMTLPPLQPMQQQQQRTDSLSPLPALDGTQIPLLHGSSLLGAAAAAGDRAMLDLLQPPPSSVDVSHPFLSS